MCIRDRSPRSAAALLGDLATVGDGGGPGPGDPARGCRGGGTMVEVRRARRVHVEHRRGASLLAAALDAAEAEKAAGGPAYRAALDLALALASDALVVVNSLQHAVPLKLCDAGDVARARRDDGDFVAWLAAAAGARKKSNSEKSGKEAVTSSESGAVSCGGQRILFIVKCTTSTCRGCRRRKVRWK